VGVGTGVGANNLSGVYFGSGLLLSEFCISLGPKPIREQGILQDRCLQYVGMKTGHKINYFFQKNVYDED
jgi:hypothetical protein